MRRAGALGARGRRGTAQGPAAGRAMRAAIIIFPVRVAFCGALASRLWRLRQVAAGVVFRSAAERRRQRLHRRLAPGQMNSLSLFFESRWRLAASTGADKELLLC